MTTKNHPSHCPICGSSEIETEVGLPEPACGSCGVVLTGDIDIEPLDNETSEETDSADWADFYSISNSTEKQVAEAMEKIETLGERLNFGASTRDKAADIYRDAAVGNHTDGRATTTIVAASLCLATQGMKNAYPVEYLAREVGISDDNLRNAVRVLRRELDREFAIVRPEDYLQYLCKKTGEDDETKQRAQTILAEIQAEVHVSGKNPCGIAAAAIYVAANAPASQRELARVAGVTTETIRVRLNEIREVVNDE
jgi:transcription initiation factor TFIIIB Brf1 subunit/transcription initiation factor TFIIB